MVEVIIVVVILIMILLRLIIMIMYNNIDHGEQHFMNAIYNITVQAK